MTANGRKRSHKIAANSAESRHQRFPDPPISHGKAMLLVLKWKIWRIEAGLKTLVKSVGVRPTVWSFGAYYIDPKHLVFVVGVPSDKERDDLRLQISFQSQMRNLLAKYNWPAQARENVQFDIESQETVDRENNGNWWYHYK